MTYTGNFSWTLTKPYTRTQELTLSEQLAAGIRYLDIRIKNNMGIYHGPAYLNSDFEEVLTVVTDFLDDNPSETIVMRAKDEEMSDSRRFDQRIQPLITNFLPYFWKNSGGHPELGEVRGKIVILDNTGGSFQRKEGAYGFVYGDETQSIQDDYNKPSLSQKKTKISQQLNTFSTFGKPLTLNHISATAFYRTPRSYAKKLNGWLLVYLEERSINATGIIIMDFPTKALINRIIAFNY